MADQLNTALHRATLWTLESGKDRADPWGEITLVAIATGPDGAVLRVPAFWDGGRTWRFRLSAPAVGKWTLVSECSDSADAGLHGQQATLTVAPARAAGDNRFDRHGPVQLAKDGGYFEHSDGTPFHWLADTWWMLATDRVSFPDGFSRLTARRREQGFSVVQIVVGFQPDTTPFDGRDANAGGSPWLQGYSSINPAYFQNVDRRLQHLVENGILACILGGWGYHSLFMGKARMLQHWRYLVARYGAWPVVWCLAGEGAMAYYLSKDKPADTKALQEVWPDVARLVRETDPWHRPLTLHPRKHSWDDTADPGTLDFQMTQAGHLPHAPKISLEELAIGRARFPNQVIINGEPPYEAHAGANLADVQRYSFWSSMLAGASGYTYGAAGIYQANDRERPTGDRPDGGAYDAVFWDESMMLPGGEQIARGHALLRALDHHLFEAHPEWSSIELRFGHEAYNWPIMAFAAGIPGKVRLVYMPLRWYHWEGPLIHKLENGVRYKAAYIETNTLKRHELGVISGNTEGEWRGPTLPHMFDWLLLLEAV